MGRDSQLSSVFPSGSFAKRTAIKSGTDIDVFISLQHTTSESLREIYESLFQRAANSGYAPKRQNVSINIKVNGLDVDLVPGRRQDGQSLYHSLYRRRADTWTQTNVQRHIAYVVGSGRLDEIRVIKLWRNQKKFDFPSFYLEMAVIEALKYARGTLSQNVARTLEYLRDDFATARFVDPANSNNVISEDLKADERMTIARWASFALSKTWGDVVR